MVDSKIRIPGHESQQGGNSYLQRCFSNHLNCAALHVTFRTPSVVIRLALHISTATLTPASLLWSGPSADIIELAARVKSRASSLLVKVKHYLIRSHVRASYSLFLQMIGRFSIRVRLSLLVRLIVESSAQQQISELASARENLSLNRGRIFARDTNLQQNTLVKLLRATPYNKKPKRS